MGDMQIVRMRPILCHQQPAGEARLYHMKTVARSRLRKLSHPYIDVAVHTSGLGLIVAAKIKVIIMAHNPANCDRALCAIAQSLLCE